MVSVQASLSTTYTSSRTSGLVSTHTFSCHASLSMCHFCSYTASLSTTHVSWLQPAHPRCRHFLQPGFLVDNLNLFIPRFFDYNSFSPSFLINDLDLLVPSFFVNNLNLLIPSFLVNDGLIPSCLSLNPYLFVVGCFVCNCYFFCAYLIDSPRLLWYNKCALILSCVVPISAPHLLQI